MSFWQLFLIAVGVSADAFAVALGKGLHMRHLRYRNALIIAVTFGLFQAIMPLIGQIFDHIAPDGTLAPDPPTISTGAR